MAFSLASRFPPPRDLDECIFGPGAYQNQLSVVIPKSKAPFNSNASRDAGTPKPYSEQIYFPVLKRHIPNCAAFRSSKPRFSYEALSKEDIENLICRCPMACDCPVEGEDVEPKKEEVCQKEVPRKLILGRPPRSIVKGGLVCKSMTSDTEVKVKRGEPDPPFYNTKVFETTTFYHGCKWSQRTGKRFKKTIEDSEVRPGPGAYTIEQKPRDDVLCAEKVRFLCRKASKQPRLAEIIQNLELRHGGPGPAAYYPREVKHNAVSVSGSRASRFATKKYDITPGPADYTMKSKFDLPKPPAYFSRAKLPEPSFFGIKAPRFKDIKQVGPGPADYMAKVNLCKIQHCVEGAPFGTSAPRFKAPKAVDDHEVEESEEEEGESHEPKQCKQLSWMFKSTSRRGELTPRPVEPKVDELPPERKNRNLFVKKKVHDEHIAPFQSSEGRFLPWNDWMSVYGRLPIPGPGAYSLDKPKCYHPAVVHGPLFRAPKTPFFSVNEGPGPSERNIRRGLNIKTFNVRLQNNEVKRANAYHWIPPKGPRKLTLEEKESLLLKQSIALLDDLSVLQNKRSKTSILADVPKQTSTETKCQLRKPKLLRCFLGHQVHCR